MIFYSKNAFFSLFLLSITAPYRLFGQLFLDGASNTSIEKHQSIVINRSIIENQSSSFHSSIKPYLNSEINAVSKKDSTTIKKTFPIHLRPIILMRGFIPNQKYDLLGGIEAGCSLKNNFTLHFTGLLGQSNFIDHVDSAASKTGVVPGIGKGYKGTEHISYQNIGGYISYSPNSIFNFQLGKDKHFWGDGYRSLLLSDFSPNYPFLRISTSVWKIKYVVMYAQFIDATVNNAYKKKYGSFHYLSWNATKRINMSLFESIIWQGNDANRKRSFDVNYLNPMIFFRPVEYSLGSSDNAFLGLNLKINLFKKQQFFSQLLLDEFLLKEVISRKGWWANKQAIQIGIRSFDVFKIKSLCVETELNIVRPYTYSHGSTQQNYGHYYYPLAHPLGANFIESISHIYYTYKKYRLKAEFLYASYGKDDNGKNYGHSIFTSYANRSSDYGNYIGQGLKTKLYFINASINYSIIPKWNINIELGGMNRIENTENNSFKNTYFYIGIKSNLWNEYFDF